MRVLIPVGLGRTVLVSCDDDTVSPISLLSEDKESETSRKISFVLDVVSEIVTIL